MRWIGIVTGILAFIAGIFLRSRPLDADVQGESGKQEEIESNTSELDISRGDTTPHNVKIADPPDPATYAKVGSDSSTTQDSSVATHETATVEIIQQPSKAAEQDSSSTMPAVCTGYTVKASTPVVTWSYDTMESGDEPSTADHNYARKMSSMNVQFDVIDHQTTKPALSPMKIGLNTEYYRLFLGVSLCVMLSFNIPTVHLPSFAEDEGESTGRAGSLLSILGGAQIVGRIVHGYYADRYGAVKCVSWNFGQRVRVFYAP